MMKVLCVTAYSDKPETEMFIGLKKFGLDIWVACPSDAPHYQRLIEAGIPVIDIKICRRFDLSAVLILRRFLKANNIDILHLFNNRAVSNGILSSVKLPVKIVVYRGIVGNVSFLSPASWITYLHPKVNRIVCVAEAVRQYFLSMKFLWLRVPHEKVVTIYKGHSLNWYQNKPADLSEFNIPPEAFVVGCVANFRPRKGLHILIDSAKYLPVNAPIHFLLVGKMDDPSLVKQIEKSPFRNNIHLAGYRSDASAISAACHTVILPALRREGLPKVIIEAMAYGVPPIVTDSGGSPELVRGHKCGIVVPPGDSKEIARAIMRLYEYPDLRSEIGKHAKKQIESAFHIDKTIKKTIELYKDLLKE